MTWVACIKGDDVSNINFTVTMPILTRTNRYCHAPCCSLPAITDNLGFPLCIPCPLNVGSGRSGVHFSPCQEFHLNIFDSVFVSADSNVSDIDWVTMIEEAIPVPPRRHRQRDVLEHITKEDATPEVYPGDLAHRQL